MENQNTKTIDVVYNGFVYTISQEEYENLLTGSATWNDMFG